jgi:hypothetical protein
MSRSRLKKGKLSSGGYLPLASTSNKKALLWSVGLGWLLSVCALAWGFLFANDIVTLGGVPAKIVGRFLQDPTALLAFFTADKNSLHQRLQDLGIEEQIKDYYRPRIPDEIELDRYIHQLLYHWTGYVGKNYLVNPEGVLVLKKSGEIRLKREINENSDKIVPGYLNF